MAGAVHRAHLIVSYCVDSLIVRGDSCDGVFCDILMQTARKPLQLQMFWNVVIEANALLHCLSVTWYKVIVKIKIMELILLYFLMYIDCSLPSGTML